MFSSWPFRVNPQEDPLGLPCLSGLSGHHGLRRLCFPRKSAWLDGFAGAAHERWSIGAEGPQQHSGPGGAKDGIGGASIKTRGKACFIPWQCQVDSPSDPARARHCGRRCNLVLHLMPHRLVCCMVFRSRTCTPRWGVRTGGSDANGKSPNGISETLQLPGKLWKSRPLEVATHTSKLDLRPYLRPELGPCQSAKQSSKLDFRWFIQPEPRPCQSAKQSSKLDFWWFMPRVIHSTRA